MRASSPSEKDRFAHSQVDGAYRICTVNDGRSGLIGISPSLSLTRVIERAATESAKARWAPEPTTSSTASSDTVRPRCSPSFAFISRILRTDSSILDRVRRPLSIAITTALIAVETSFGERSTSAPASNARTEASPIP